MEGVALLTRGMIVQGQNPAVTMATWGFILFHFPQTVVPGDFVPTFIIRRPVVNQSILFAANQSARLTNTVTIDFVGTPDQLLVNSTPITLNDSSADIPIFSVEPPRLNDGRTDIDLLPTDEIKLLQTDEIDLLPKVEQDLLD